MEIGAGMLLSVLGGDNENAGRTSVEGSGCPNKQMELGLLNGTKFYNFTVNLEGYKFYVCC